MADIETVLAGADPAIKSILRSIYLDGYEAGREAGKKEAVDELRSKLSGLLDPLPAANEPDTDEADETSMESDGRASPGTVKPAILELIKAHPEGLTTREIAKKTGFKFNSVRGTVWWLASKDNAIERRGQKWFALPDRPPAPANLDLSDLLGQTNEPSDE